MDKITIKTYALKHGKNDVVRLHPAAQKIINQLHRESGLSTTYLVSEIICQAKDYVVFEEITDGSL